MSEVMEMLDNIDAAIQTGLEQLRHAQGVLAKIWAIASETDDPGADPDYDTNNLYDLIREGVQAKKDLAAERERCARIAETFWPQDGPDTNQVETVLVTLRRVAEKIRSRK